MLFVEKIFSLCEKFLSHVHVMGKLISQNFSCTISTFYSSNNIVFGTSHFANYLAKFIWKTRAKFRTKYFVKTRQKLDHHLWSIFAFNVAPIFATDAQINFAKSDQTTPLNFYKYYSNATFAQFTIDTSSIRYFINISPIFEIGMINIMIKI